VIRNVSMTGEQLFCTYLKDAHTHVEQYYLEGKFK